MSDYIPTKDLIKECYVEAMELETDSPNHSAEFDRWFNQQVWEVIQATEERIIKLLEDNARPNAASGDDIESFGFREGFRHAIALIKGENK